MSQNYDATELAKFAELAVHWWDPQGELQTLHQINPLRLCYIKEKTSLTGKQAIDIGCGGGILSESLYQEGASVVGVDLNQSLIDVANLHQLESNTKVTYHCTSAEEMALQYPNSFDVVTCLEMLEHVPDPLAIIKACYTLAKPGGHLFFSTLNRNLKAYLLAIIGAEYVLKILPQHTHDYAKFIKPHELADWARQAGLQPQDTRGISYHVLSKSFSLTSNISVNYLFYATK